MPFLAVNSSAQESGATVYYGLAGYSQFPQANTELARANESLSLVFKSCQKEGILLYATDAFRTRYFSIGLFRARVLIEFDLGEGIAEVSA